MKVLHVTFDYDKSLPDEKAFLAQYYTITGWAEALQRQGAEVTVMSRFYKDNYLKKNNVQYYFIKDRLGEKISGLDFPIKFLKKISQQDADIIHLHHLSLSLQTSLLRFILDKKTAIIVQHHGGPLPAKGKRVIHNFFNLAADGFFFTSVEQGKEWFNNKKNWPKIMPVMEGATFFNFSGRDAGRKLIYYDRVAARKITGLNGSPVFLWVGRLDSNKDPLTILEGFETLFKKYPDAGFYMIYSDNRMAGEIEKKVMDSAILKSGVHLLGKIAHEEIEMYYHSADYFVLGSHYEGSGYALSEALSCGCVPVITDIPSFRVMTDGGRLGALWMPGDKNSFVEAANRVLGKPLAKEANDCIDFFKAALSFDSIARVAAFYYLKTVKKRNPKTINKT